VTDLLGAARARSVDLAGLSRRVGRTRVGDELLRVRETLQAARNGLPEVQTPRILYPPTQSFTIWLARAFDALAIVEAARLAERALTAAERARVDALLADGASLYRDGRDALIRLRCRAQIPDCSVSSLPG
jgi:hypothetical protein